MKSAIALTLALLIVAPASLTQRAYAGGYAQSTQTTKAPNAVKRFIKSVGGKVAIGLLAGGLLAGSLSHNSEASREHNIPLAFSEISQIERDAKASGTEVSPATAYLTRTNEAAMKVFEAYDLSYSKLRSGSHENRFAKELGIKMRTQVHSHELPGLLEELPAKAETFRLSLAPVEQTANGLRPVTANLKQTFDESHHDNTHTESRTRTKTVDDGGGKSHSETEAYTVEVYDNTTHTYTFNAGQGQAANNGLQAARTKVPLITNMPVLQTASSTHAEGEYAAETSRKVAAGSRLSKESLQQIANTWASGATYTQNIDHLVGLWNQTIARDAQVWSSDVNTAKSSRYITTSHSDSGPKEYQSSSRALGNVNDFTRRADEVLGSIALTQRTAPVLEAKIQQLLAIELDHSQTGNSKQLAADIIKMSRDMYGANFQKGVDTKAYRAWVVMLWVIAGLAAGGGAGRGATPAAEYIKKKLGRS